VAFSELVFRDCRWNAATPRLISSARTRCLLAGSTIYSGTLGDRPVTLKFVQGAAYVLPRTPAGSDGPPLFSPPWRRSMTPISRRSWLTLTACACASVADALSADAFAAEEIPPGSTSPFQVPESEKAPGMRVLRRL
jgi:hypothetical protein